VASIRFIRGRRREKVARSAHGAEPLEPRLFLAGNLVAAYGFNEGAGTVLGDASGLRMSVRPHRGNHISGVKRY